MSLHEALDLNSNGALGWPDLLGWTLFGSFGLLVVALLLGLVLTTLVKLGHGARATARVTGSLARRSRRGGATHDR